MIQGNLFQFEETTEWQTVAEGVQRQVLGYDDKLMLVKVKFAKGACGTLHSHAHSQVSYVESGAFEMTIGETVKIIRKGDGYYVPPFTVHGCVCLEDGMLVDGFSPARRYFLGNNSEQYTL
ncbi:MULTISPECIES: cupin domain-containing protein [unclassified Mucilaginibacter]|uniref:cupin domain-containing protein n=1 Tax=unclassified Mucilaginibacter TaxID=2617802 RepID=UPI002AC9E7B7|nr:MULTISPECIES: cupin domain-containing protein [unclassified Mucilaginibacter]MEB0260547.1 cupin domain-containing protein [Mucilaginibacter sp. 10I4]MEB0278097.1 cupin domain-containing protein [Mucilaginibacter sp. 10B2]MEB0301755.1 cupin domain-containing protein [Mucilaginibacter sp. 5C4]WPX23008.1 cupin domain-containing protein [Mucilaginibacter sp. 5C4]